MSLFNDYRLDEIVDKIAEVMKEAEDKELAYNNILQAIYYGTKDFLTK